MKTHANTPESTEELLNSVGLKAQLPIDWPAVTLLGHELNHLRNQPFGRQDLADIRPPPDAKAVVVMVASVVVRTWAPHVSCLLPTREEIETLRPWVGSLERLLGRVSPKWAAKFGEYVESRGEEAIVGAGNLVTETAELCVRFEAPRRQFLAELEALYRTVQQPVAKEGLLGDYEMPIEEKVQELFLGLWDRRDRLFCNVNEENFPLLFTLMRKFQFPGPGFSASHAGVAGAELMEGIEIFLRHQGAADVPPAPPPQGFDLLDPGTWTRGLAEAFFGEKLENVRSRLPTLLWLVLRILPESGPRVADAIYDIADRVYELSARGVSAEEIAERVFQK